MICVLIDVEILDRPCALRTLARTERSLHGPTASAPANVRANLPINGKGKRIIELPYLGGFCVVLFNRNVRYDSDGPMAPYWPILPHSGGHHGRQIAPNGAAIG